MRSEKDVVCKPFKNHHAEQLKLVTDFDWIDFDRLSDVDELISSVLSCEEAADYIDEGRIHAITESVQRRIGHLLADGDLIATVHQLFRYKSTLW